MALLVVMVGCAVYYVRLMGEGPPHLHVDSAVYYLMARSLAEGNGVYIDNTPTPTRPMYPPGYPLLLSLMVPYYDASPWVLSLVSVVMSVLLIPVLYLFGGKGARGLALATLYALHPLVALFSPSVMSEPSAMVWIFLSLVLFRRYEETRQSPRILVCLAATSALMATYTRTAAVALPVAILLALAVERHAPRRWEMLTVLGSVFAVGFWFLRHLQDDDAYYVVFVARSNVPEWDFAPRDFFMTVEGFFFNAAVFFGRNVVDILMGPLTWWVTRAQGPEGMFWAKTAVSCLLSLPILAAVWHRLTQELSLREFFFLAYLGEMLLYPDFHLEYRNMLPVVPLLLLYLWEGLVLFAEWLHWPRRQQLRLCVAAYVPLHIALVYDLAAMTFPAHPMHTGQARGNSIHDRDFHTAMHWLREHTPPDSLLVSMDPWGVWLYGDRKAVLYPLTDGAQRFREELERRRADYLIVSVRRDPIERFMGRVIQAYEKEFPLAYTSPEGQIRIYRVLPRSSAGES